VSEPSTPPTITLPTLGTSLTYHIVQRGVVAAGQKVREEIHHDQPLPFSLEKYIEFHKKWISVRDVIADFLIENADSPQCGEYRPARCACSCRGRRQRSERRRQGPDTP
jgi:hypothetical protein